MYHSRDIGWGGGGALQMINWGISLGREAALRPLVVTFSEGGREEDLDCPESSISRPKRE